jgi:peptidylprolyl isomerase
MKMLLAITFAASLAFAACGSGTTNTTKTATPPTGGVKPGASATANQPAPPTQATDGNAPGIPPLSQPIQTTPSGLRYMDEVVGTGAAPVSGQKVTVHYTGWLTTGAKFDSSRDRNQPFSFTIGTGAVIKGWDEGVLTMKVGGKRRLIIPPALAYGPNGRPPTIPASSTLIFDVELISVP